MRKRFEVQTTLGLTPLSDLLLPTTSRDELAPTLAGLQCIFLNPSLNEQIFALVEEKIPAGLQNTKGRAGMSLWEILVLAVCRLTLDANYDRIHDLANHHSLIRHLMQVSSNSFTGENKSYGLQTIKDNLMLLDEATIMKINELVVAHAHHLVLKKNEKLRIKSDTFVFETNIHFPTDYNLLWDSARKCLDILDVCSRLYDFAGWRKLAAWRSELKNLSRAVGKASSFTHKNKERAVVQAAQDYVDKAKKLEKKISESVFENWETIVQDIELSTLIEKDLVFFLSMLTKHIDLVERRLIRKEVIASSEKIHSIFELHTEWISKGKLNKAIELGHNLLISTDQFGFIL